MCVNARGMCPLSQGRVSMRMMCVLISLLHLISTILSVTKKLMYCRVKLSRFCGVKQAASRW